MVVLLTLHFLASSNLADQNPYFPVRPDVYTSPISSFFAWRYLTLELCLFHLTGIVIGSIVAVAVVVPLVAITVQVFHRKN